MAFDESGSGSGKGGGVSLAVMLEIGKAYGKQVLKDRLGIDLSE